MIFRLNLKQQNPEEKLKTISSLNDKITELQKENKKIAELENQNSKLMKQTQSSSKQEELSKLYEFRDKYVDLEIANSLLTDKNKILQQELNAVKGNIQMLQTNITSPLNDTEQDQNSILSETQLKRRQLVTKNEVYPPKQYRGILGFIKDRYNVYFRNNIQLHCSGNLKNHDVSRIHNWDVFAFISEDKADSWISIDFISMEVDIYGYKIKSSLNNRFCSWKLEGQKKNEPLTLIDKRENDPLKVSNCESEFVCQNPGSYSKFIITMIGNQFNAPNSFKMYVCGFDIYGSAYILE